MKGKFFKTAAVCGALALLMALAVRTAAETAPQRQPAPLAAGNPTAALYLDGVEQSGTVSISGGSHRITAQSNSAAAWIAVYVNGRLEAVSDTTSLDYDFPERGAEIALFSLDNQHRPMQGAVRLTQSSAAQKLAYSGEAVCYDEWNDYEEREFDDYTVRLRVITADGIITDIRDIGGFSSSGGATNDANAYYLGKAAAELPERIINKQSIEGVDAVTGATCASHAILRAVAKALESAPEPYEDDSGGQTEAVPDGVYAGTAQCLTGYMNYMVDVSATVKDGLLTEIQDRTLKTPLSTNDQTLYHAAWRGISSSIAEAKMDASAFSSVDAVTGATVSSAGINAAIRNALETRNAVPEETGEVYAPEGISLYAKTYPVVTVRDGAITEIRVVPAKGADTERLNQFAADIVKRQSVQGLDWPEGIEDGAFSIANLTDQILYGRGVLK